MGEISTLIAEGAKKLNWELVGAIFVSIMGFLAKFIYDPERGKISYGRVIIGLAITVTSATIAFYFTGGFWRYLIGFFTGLLCDRLISSTYHLWPFFIDELKRYIRKKGRS